MEFPPEEIQQPNVYPLSWNSKTKKLQEVWQAALRKNWDPEKLPWDTLNVDGCTCGRRESIAYWWSLLSVFRRIGARCLPKRIIDLRGPRGRPGAQCFFWVTRDEQNHENDVRAGDHQASRRTRTRSPTEPKTDLGRRLQKNVKWLYFNGWRYWTGYKQAVPKYDLAVLFSSFLMGEIAAATIFKQMFETPGSRCSRQGFRNIGKDEGRHMAICMARDGARLPGPGDRGPSRWSPNRSAPATSSCRPCCSSRRWSSGDLRADLIANQREAEDMARAAGFGIPTYEAKLQQLAERHAQPEGRAGPLQHPLPGHPRGGHHRPGNQRRGDGRHHSRLLIEA